MQLHLVSILRPLLAVPLLLMLLAGCSATSVVVDGQFPTEAIVERLPIRMGVHYDEAFTSFAIDEPIPERGDWNIAIGDAQANMFRSVLPAMFDAVVELQDPLANADVDAVLVPRVEDMQFAIPFQTKSNFFEVWIRYQLTLTEPATGTVIAIWPLTAYGRTRDAMLASAEAALEQAAVMALRDAAAFLAIDFSRTEELAPWLEKTLHPASAELALDTE